MSEANHDLAHEFPEYRDKIHELKTHNRHFVTVSERYHDVVRELHRIESGAETPSDEYVETLKKRRLAFKDELAAMLCD